MEEPDETRVGDSVALRAGIDVSAGWAHGGAFLTIGGMTVRLSDEQAHAVGHALMRGSDAEIAEGGINSTVLGHGDSVPQRPVPRPQARPGLVSHAPGVPRSPVGDETAAVDGLVGSIVHSTVTGEDVAPLDVAADDIRFLPDAQMWAERLGVDAARVVAILEAPLEEWTAPTLTGTASVASDGEVAVAVSLDSTLVLAVMTHEAALRRRPPTRQAVQRVRGGDGTRYPTSYAELRRTLLDLGCEIVPTSGHVRVHYDGKTVTLPTTPSDYRSLMNSSKNIERFLGLSVTRSG